MTADLGFRSSNFDSASSNRTNSSDNSITAFNTQSITMSE